MLNHRHYRHYSHPPTGEVHLPAVDTACVVQHLSKVPGLTIDVDGAVWKGAGVGKDVGKDG